MTSNKTERHMEPDDLYVVVIHVQSGRAFGLSRRYELKVERLYAPYGYTNNCPLLDTWDGWLPTSDEQKPEWAKGLPESEFKAFWIVGPSEVTKVP